ncbi:MAG: YkgJ family cysteine cluster protein [Pirellulales bacterium]
MNVLPAKLPREQVPPDDVLCNHCTAKCCRYFALPLEPPTTWSDFDFIRWYLMHTPATLFTEGESWYLVVHNECQHLLPDNRCGVYETRPQICRDYSTKECEYEDDWVYERYFETPEQIFEFAEALLGPPPHDPRLQPAAGANGSPKRKKVGKRAKAKLTTASFRSPAPPLLPIVG